MKHTQTKSLYTARGAALNGQPWQAYPRPALQRDAFTNLNGWWDFAVSSSGEIPAQWTEKILVPYPPQSLLSGIHRDIPEGDFLFYRTAFPRPARQGRVLVHIGAADQEAAVLVNGTPVGAHTGGYEPFTFDITAALTDGENTLIIRVLDHMSRGVLPYGKQRANRGGMWYTPVSGIWQTVWLETVPDTYIRGLDIRTDGAAVTVTAEGVDRGVLTVKTPDSSFTASLEGGTARFTVPDPRLWSPEDPYLYHFTLTAGEDTVRSYFALRTLDVRTVNGYPRLCLNGKPFFFHGLLDQGYWSDGLLTPAAPECYEDDILAMKALGFNTLRKHIKIEPQQFYYDCDRLGMIVVQDMVNNGDYSFIRDTALPTVGIKRLGDHRLHRDEETRRAFLTAMEQTVRQLKHHPSICCWTIFNEGWGQFESGAAYRRLRQLDDTRFIDTVSGWFTAPDTESDVVSDHVYFKPFRMHRTEKPLVLSEFGGYALTLKEHAFNPDHEYGYRKFTSREDLEAALVKLYETEIVPAAAQGLCAAIYTQVSDVEDETNGLLTYDRAVCKVSPAAMLPIAEALKLS